MIENQTIKDRLLCNLSWKEIAPTNFGGMTTGNKTGNDNK